MGPLAGSRMALCLVLFLLLLLPPPLPVSAEDADAVASTPASETTSEAPIEAALDPEATAILRRATELLSGLKSFSFEADSAFDVVQTSGQKLQFTTAQKIFVRRPNRVYSEAVRDDGVKRQVYYNGHYLTMYQENHKVYGTIPVPSTIDATLDYVEERGIVRMPVSDLLYSDLSFLEKKADYGDYVGESRVGGVPCDHLAFGNESIDWQLWIQKSGKPLFRKVLIDYKERPGQPQYGARLNAWKLSASLPDSRFLFSPPEDAERIKFLTGAPLAGVEGEASR